MSGNNTLKFKKEVPLNINLTSERFGILIQTFQFDMYLFYVQHEQIITDLEDRLRKEEKHRQELEKNKRQLESEIANLRDRIAELEMQVEELQSLNARKDKELAALQEK